MRPIGFRQIAIRTAGTGHGGSEFGPHHSVAERHESAEHPAEDGLRAVGFGEENWNCDEGSNADHLQHVG